MKINIGPYLKEPLCPDTQYFYKYNILNNEAITLAILISKNHPDIKQETTAFIEKEENSKSPAILTKISYTVEEIGFNWFIVKHIKSFLQLDNITEELNIKEKSEKQNA